MDLGLRHGKQKGSGDRRSLCGSTAKMTLDYFRLSDTFWKAVFNLPPMPYTKPMITTEIPAAIRPYSMAVAPASSRTKAREKGHMSRSPELSGAVLPRHVGSLLPIRA